MLTSMFEQIKVYGVKITQKKSKKQEKSVRLTLFVKIFVFSH